MSTIFSKIVSGEIPCYKIAETEDFLAFLDVNPLKRGHVLAIPKKANDYIFDLEDDALAGLMIFSKIVSIAVRKAIPCKRIGIAVIGLEVPHVHVHLIPLEHVADIDFSQPKKKFTPEEFEETAKLIRSHLGSSL